MVACTTEQLLEVLLCTIEQVHGCVLYYKKKIDIDLLAYFSSKSLEKLLFGCEHTCYSGG